MVLPSAKRPEPLQRLIGTLGEFRTAAGPVHYLLTKATVSLSAAPSSGGLASHLRLVREVLDVKELPFDQLLQRDLDDHRVATKLIPYLLQPQAKMPPFFPPILAMVLPIATPEAGAEFSKPLDAFPAASPETAVEDDGSLWLEQRLGDTLRIRRLAEADRTASSRYPVGEIAWNPRGAALVVLDGQHRAMALLAIHRHLNPRDIPESFRRFTHFYEDQLRELEARGALSKSREAGWSIELPITICWTPADGPAPVSPVEMARKLFVDVNQSARAMGRSRSLLLSDQVVTGELMRAFLAECRDEKWPLPLCAVDYEERSTGRQRAQPRWNALTTLKHLEPMFTLATQGPASVATRVDANFGGAGKAEKRRDRLLLMLDATNLPFDTPLIEQAVSVVEVPSGNGEFSEEVVCLHPELRKSLGRRFVRTWGRAIATLLASVPPYTEQLQTLLWLKREVEAAPKAQFASTVCEALFDGSGLFYVLESAHFHHAARAAKSSGTVRIRRAGTDLLGETQSAVAKAWAELETWHSLYKDHLVSIVPGQSQAAPQAYWHRERALTEDSRMYAFQLGLLLTLTALADACAVEPDDVSAFAERFAEGLSRSAEQKSPRGDLLRYVLLRREDAPAPALNLLEGMEPGASIYYRYLWLELLHAAPDAFWATSPFGRGSRDTVRRLASLALTKYRDHIFRLKEKYLKRERGRESPGQIRDEALRQTDIALREALAAWFGWTDQSYNLWKIEHKLD